LKKEFILKQKRIVIVLEGELIEDKIDKEMVSNQPPPPPTTSMDF